MRKAGWFPIFKREAAAYFNSPVAAIFLMIFSGLSGGLFMTSFFLINRAEMRAFFDMLPWLLAVFLPAVTMRSWAEERRGNTLELLLTFPMNASSLAAGKFFAALLFFSAALLSTAFIPVMLFTLGVPDLGQITAGYMGALFLGAFFLAGGIFISGFCRDQIAAFVLSLVFCLGVYMIGQELVAETLDGWAAGLGTWLKSAWGAMPRYAVFVRGVVDFRDVLFFSSGTFIFLLLNTFWMEARSRRGAGLVFAAACVLCCGIFLALNGAAANMPLRTDWTNGKIYTLAPSSRKILNKLQAPALIRLYISPRDKMPTAFKTLERDLVSKLEELRLAAPGKLKYEIVHMEASNALDSEQAEKTAEAQITKKGVYPFQVQSVESDQVELKLIYAALTLSYLEKPEDIIPQIYPQDLAQLEYRLVSKIYKMTFEKYPKIALVAPFEEKAVNPETAAILEQLTGGKMPELQRDDPYEILERILYYEGYPFDRINISENEPLSDEYTALFLIEPRLLSERQKYEINRFVRGGGSVLMAVQNYTYEYAPHFDSIEVQNVLHHPQINSLLNAWGAAVSDRLLLDENNEMVRIGGGGLFDTPVPVKLPTHILIPPQGFNPTVPMMQGLGSLFYLWGTAVEKKDMPENLKWTVLFSSSPLSHEAELPSAAWHPADLKKIPAVKQGPLPLGAMIEGVFPDAFQGRTAPAWSEEKADQKPAVKPPVNPEKSKLILLGASSMFQSNLLRGGGHYQLMLNILDTLTFGGDLVDIRAKQTPDRTMTKISRTEKLVWRLVVTFFVPFIVLVLSIYRLAGGIREKQKYLKAAA